MVGEEEAVAAALRLAADDPPGVPITGVSQVFSRDEGESWAVHLRVIFPPRIEGESVIERMPEVRIVGVNGKSGVAHWVEML